MNYKIIDKSTYYRKDIYRRFTEDCKCSVSMTARLDVTDFAEYSQKTDTKFYINFLYIFSKVLNSRDDYKMDYLYKTDELVCYDVINPTHYVFRDQTETCTPVYSEYCEDYEAFYKNVLNDIEKAKQSNEPAVFDESHPNWFDASYIPWVSYDSLHTELPDGYLYFPPIVHWGKYREENGRLMMPVTVRLNHAIADGYLVAKVFDLLGKEMEKFINNK
ncbi:MAG: chloramphenicol acetyltransferase [Clostridia bacterium]|nr:chloramphenicol acetyltransferase [Clostridia bacterium]